MRRSWLEMWRTQGTYRSNQEYLQTVDAHGFIIPCAEDTSKQRLMFFSPPARWGLLDFMLDARLLLLHPSSFFLLLLPPSSLAGSHLPALDRREPALDTNGPRRTSTSESLSAVGLAGLQPARVGALWASPDFNRRGSERCGPRQTSTG